ncbi:MAG TPA: nucleotide exchange factor GrpE [Patescibacteria group bacterium]|nr:nucleotide exchange factor GrpE [Patescibacteria group bacterium]
MKKQIKENKNLNLKGNEELKNQLARALADYANLKKRSDEERNTMYKLASISFVLKLLPILDSLREAQKHLGDQGIAIIVGQLEIIFKEDGFIEVKPQIGEKFNEHLHEAIDTLETDKEEDNNMISEIVLSGWKFGEEVVRFAKVKVFKKNLDQKDGVNKIEGEENK